MGLMDKVRAQSTQLAQMAQETAREGKVKLDQAQAKRRADAMFRDLGATVYAERTGRGTPDSKGKIDRLVRTSDSILIADYKTNRPAPGRLDEVPGPYVRQLALYRAVLGKLYPDRAIRAALIWTDVPDLMELPAAAMDHELAAVTSA